MTLPIPFFQRLFFYTNTAYWEQNEWKRRYGYQFPYDTYFLLQWAASLSLDLLFYYFLIHFITPPQDETMDAAWNLVKAWPLALEQDLISSSWLWASHARQVMTLICIGIKVLSVAVSLIDTEDPVIKAKQVSRSKTYVKKYGVSVIDPYTSICGICQVKVAKSTRHCKLCNKCIDGMDHHCKWLNCCIGRANYRIFFMLVISAFISLIWYSSLALYVLFLCFYRRNIFIIQVIQMLDLAQAKNPLESMTQKYYLYMGVACFVTVFSVTALVAMAWLLGFHIRLACLDMTTIEFISHPMYHSIQYGNDSTDDEYSVDDQVDGYSDDSNIDKAKDLEDETVDKPRSWTANTSGSLKQEGHVIGVLNAWIHKMFRQLTGPVEHRYGRLASKGGSGASHDVDGPGKFGVRKLFDWLEKRSRRKHKQRQRRHRSSARDQHGDRRRKRHDSPTGLRNDINLEEILATKTIWQMPTVLGSDGPDYDDDMGLDTNILDQDGAMLQQHVGDNGSNSLSNRYLLSPLERRSSAIRSVFSSSSSSSSKATRMSDNSNTEAKLYLTSRSPDTISID